MDTKRRTTMIRWAAPTLMVLAQAMNGCAAPDEEKQPVQVSEATKAHDVKTKDWCPSGASNCWEVTVTDDSPMDPWTAADYDPYGGGSDDQGDHGGGGGGGSDDHGDPGADSHQSYGDTYWAYLSGYTKQQIADRSKENAMAKCVASVTPADNGVTHCEAGTYIWGNRLVHTTVNTACTEPQSGWLGEWVSCTTEITIDIQVVH